MEIKKLNISGAWQTYSPIIEDNRGTFKELFNFSANFEQTGLNFNVAQSIYTKSKKGVIRGIHYSLNPLLQWKWISCVNGSILDVIVDIRIDSPTFGKFEQIELNDIDGKGVLIQANLGHAFQSLSDNSTVVYNLSSSYKPELQKIINPLDKRIAIRWPLTKRIISEKDLIAPTFQEQIEAEALPSIIFNNL
jgi:dTDP-4-dehydrorhamnose 3,5-epimerase